MAKKYWLFKSEPNCFSIDDLAGLPGKTDHWDGVRNYQARNMLRDDIKKGDSLFFYNSSCKQVGIAGICEVVKSGYPDFTAMEPEGQHYDPKATKANPIWYMVDIKLSRKFQQIVLLSDLKKTAGLEDMVLTQKGSRLSIQPVRRTEWQIIMKLSAAGR